MSDHQDERALRFYATHSEERRPVYVRVDKFTGYGKHVHVTMREADDPYWSDDAERWLPPEDPEDPAKGRVRVMKFNRPEIARRWIETTFHDEFDEATHELIVEKGESYNWFYGEGE